MTKVVALTGGIGSGKSAVAKLFESKGATIVDADILAREVVKPGSPGLRAIVEQFSPDLVLADGSLNRPLLASIIFSDPSKRELLESIIHPLIRERWLTELEKLRAAHTPIVVYVIPLLFESNRVMPELGTIVLVTAPHETRIKRIMDRDGFTREMAELRMSAQLPDSEKISKSDYVIANDATLLDLEQRVGEIWSELTRG
jgi:dephospho-CoA kinase